MSKKHKKIIDFFKNKKVLILGCQKEGLSTYLFFRKLFPQKIFHIADLKNMKDLNQKWQKIIKNDKHLQTFFGENHLNKIETFDIIIKSPGIPITIPEIQKALKNKTVVTSNTQLFFDFFSGKTIGVTGTKGKSTTTNLIYHMLKNNDLPVFMAGNIGVPPLSQITKTSKKALAVLELSCHQLNELESSPNFAVIQNVTSEHLDYYKTTKEYVSAKKQIAKFQNKNDYVIFNNSYPNPTKIANLSIGKKLTFRLKKNDDCVCYLDKNKIFYQNKLIIDVKEIKLKGKHNLENIMAAIVVAKLFNISNQKIKESLISFSPLSHRLEFVTKKNDVSYYNDSLATMPDATIAALETFNSKNVILIAGGHERRQNFNKLAQKIKDLKLKNIILFKPTGLRLAQELKKMNSNTQIQFVSSMQEAILTAKKISQKGDIVLLSPASASFGLFKDYQDRGNQFKKEVFRLVE